MNITPRRLHSALRQRRKHRRVGARCGSVLIRSIYHAGWKDSYDRMLLAIAEQMDWGRLFDVSVGSFRVSQDYLKKMRKNAPDSAVVQFPYENDRGVYHYGDGLTREMEGFLVERLSQYLPEEKIFLWEKEET